MTNNMLQNISSMSQEDEEQKKIQAERTSAWDRHDSTDLIEERKANWLNDERFLEYENDDESLFGRGDDYFERSQEENENDDALEIEDYID